MNNTKKWWKSKTIIFNGLAGAFTLLSTHSEIVTALVPGAGAYLPAVIAIGNIAIRFATSSKLVK